MTTIKKIEDELLQDDIVKVYCKQCDKNTLFKIIGIGKTYVGQCSKCRGYLDIKNNDNYISVSSTPIVTCPYCHSTNTKKISTMSKASAVALFGVFAVGKVSRQWKCSNCGSEF